MKNGVIKYHNSFIGPLLVQILFPYSNGVFLQQDNRTIATTKPNPRKRKSLITVQLVSYKLYSYDAEQTLSLKFNLDEFNPTTCVEIAQELNKVCKDLEIKIKTA